MTSENSESGSLAIAEQFAAVLSSLSAGDLPEKAKEIAVNDLLGLLIEDLAFFLVCAAARLHQNLVEFRTAVKGNVLGRWSDPIDLPHFV